MVGFQLRFCHALLFLLIVRSYESRTSYKIITYQCDVLPCWHELLYMSLVCLGWFPGLCSGLSAGRWMSLGQGHSVTHQP